MASDVEDRAMKLAYDFFEKNGWNPADVSRVHGAHGGYDLLLTKNSRTLTVEVKGSGKPYHGIPDLYHTQLDTTKNLVADYLCVGYFPPGGTEKLAIIPRAGFGPDAFNQVPHYCIKPKYKNRSFISERLVDLNEPWTA